MQQIVSQIHNFQSWSIIRSKDANFIKQFWFALSVASWCWEDAGTDHLGLRERDLEENNSSNQSVVTQIDTHLLILMKFVRGSPNEESSLFIHVKLTGKCSAWQAFCPLIQQIQSWTFPCIKSGDTLTISVRRRRVVGVGKGWSSLFRTGGWGEVKRILCLTTCSPLHTTLYNTPTLRWEGDQVRWFLTRQSEAISLEIGVVLRRVPSSIYPR